MIFSNCPRCGSDRIRRGYRHTPFWWKIIGRYHLLCNSCNWEFIGFAVPGTIELDSARRRKKRHSQKNLQPPTTLDESNPSSDELKKVEEVPKTPQRIKIKKRVRVKLKK